MRRPFWKLVVFLFVGAILGTLAGHLLAHQIRFLSQSTSVEWHPQADLAVLRFSLDIVLKVNWLTLVGVIVAWLVARKAK